MKRLWIVAIALTVSVTVFAQQEGTTACEVLILLAHPDMVSSKANAAMIESVKDLPYVRVINIYEAPFEAAIQSNPGVKGKTLTVATTTGSDNKPH